MDRLDVIKNEPAFWSRVGFAEDPTRFDEGGNISFYDENWDVFLKEHKSFFEKGIKLHTFIIHNGWVGTQKYDFSAVDKTLEAVSSIDEGILLMPRIKLNPPIEWCFENPTEVALSEDADRSEDGIKRLLEKFVPYFHTNGYSGNVPTGEGFPYLCSFSSKKWLFDVSKAVEKLIEHIESSKYAERIIAYQIGLGMCGENAYWGSWSAASYWGDFGISAVKNFEEYCSKKYGSLEKAREVYGIESGERIVPSPKKRWHEPTSLCDFFREDNAQSIDYEKFIGETVVDSICSVAKIIKSKTQKPIGTFYGYIYTEHPSESGHLEIDRLISGDEIDFIASPKGYYRSGAGYSGGTQACSASVGRKKIWFDEIDNGTHVGRCIHNPANHPKSFNDTRTVFWREICKNLAWGNLNYWIMDLVGGWFDDNGIMDEIGRAVAFSRDMRKLKRESVAEILLVTDEKSEYYVTSDPKLTGSHSSGVLNEITTNLFSCGAPVDVCRVADLEEIDLSRYKMAVFANVFYLDGKSAEVIRKMRESTLCIFNYATGIYSPDYSIDNVERVVGMAVKERPLCFVESDGYSSGVKLPPIEIVVGYDEILDRYSDGGIKSARAKNSVLYTVPNLNSQDFNRLARSAGCKLFADAGTTVYADNRFTGIFPSKEVEIFLDGRYKEIVTDKIYQNCTVSLCEKGVAVFIKEDE